MKPSLSLTLAISAGAVIVAIVHSPELTPQASSSLETRTAAQSPHGAFRERVQTKIDGIVRMRDLPPVPLSRSSKVP